MNRKLAITLIPMVLVAILLIPQGSLGANDEDDERVLTERFFANARVTGIMATGATEQIQVNFTRWSTDEERSELLQKLADKGPDNFPKYLRRQETTGWVRTTQSLRWELRYARDIQTDEGRQIIAASDRPIGFREATNRGRSLDYNTTLIILNVDEEGRGTGQVFVGAEIVFDEESNTMTVEGASDRPVELVNVRKR